MRTTAEAIQKLARDPKWVGGEMGLLGVPQTWRRDLGYHVHTHFIVPGGGISADGKRPAGAAESLAHRLGGQHQIGRNRQKSSGIPNGKVTFSYKDARGKWHSSTLDAERFISRFLQHVLPKGFVKVRYYGFLSPRKRDLLGVIKELFGRFTGEVVKSGSGSDFAAAVRVRRCPKCGSEMVVVEVIKPERGRAPPWLYA